MLYSERPNIEPSFDEMVPGIRARSHGTFANSQPRAGSLITNNRQLAIAKIK
jgi:hypothetical protein